MNTAEPWYKKKPRSPLTPPSRTLHACQYYVVTEQTSPTSERVDARASTLRALHTLTVSCWPRIQTHAAKLLCALLWTCGDISRRSPDGKDLSIGGGNPADEVVLRHATRLGALVLVLSGESGKSTLREICSALRALRPAAAAMQKLAEETEVDRQGVESARD